MSISSLLQRSLSGWLLALLLALPAYSQTIEDGLRMSERNPAVGVRMVGLSGAGMYAGIADFSSLFANPAGLAYFSASQFSGSLSGVNTEDDVLYQTPNFSERQSRDLRNTTLGNVAYVHRVPTRRGSLVVAGSLHRTASFDRSLAFGASNQTSSVTDIFMPFDSDYEVREDDQGYYPYFFRDLSALAYEGGAIEFFPEHVDTGLPLFDQAVLGGTRIDQQGLVLEEGGITEMSFGGAVEAAQGVMVGLSANILFGTYHFSSILEEIDAFGENEDYTVALDDGLLVGLDFLTYEQGFESQLVGVNLRGGVSGEIVPGVRMGVSVETPTFKGITEDYWENVETVFLEGGSLASSRDGSFDYSITTPWKLGLGFAYQAGGLTAGIDAEFVDWAQMRFDADIDQAYFDGLNRDVRDAFDPVVNVRAGAEYRLGSVALRGGLAHQPDPRSNATATAGDLVDRGKTTVSAGLGYRFTDQFSIDFAWARQQFDDFYRPYVVADGPVAEETVTRDRFMVGFSVTL
ncbi:MAG: OmpP1/FadL family transporter [Rhodothermales bacterium]